MKLFKLLLLLTIITNHKSLFSYKLNPYRHFFGINIVLSNNNTKEDIIKAAQELLTQGNFQDLNNQINSGNFTGAYGNNGKTYSPGIRDIITTNNAKLVIDNLKKTTRNSYAPNQFQTFINMLKRLQNLVPYKSNYYWTVTNILSQNPNSNNLNDFIDNQYGSFNFSPDSSAANAR